MKLFHVSKTGNLKILEPHTSTHGKPYVYATPNLEFSLFFGSKKSWGDFDGIYGLNDGVPYFFEAYEGALKRRFGGQVCYVYEVDPTNFETGKTNFKGEVVSEKPVQVLSETKIENLYNHLLNLFEEGKINLHFFEHTKAYRKMIDNHISKRIIEFGALENKSRAIYKICQEKFPQIVETLEKEKQR